MVASRVEARGILARGSTEVVLDQKGDWEALKRDSSGRGNGKGKNFTVAPVKSLGALSLLVHSFHSIHSLDGL